MWIIIDIGFEVVEEGGSNFHPFREKDDLFRVLLFRIKS